MNNLFEDASKTATSANEAAHVNCVNCKARKHCLPPGLTESELGCAEDIVAVRRKLKRGETLVRQGESFTGLYAVRRGFFKTFTSNVGAREQVIGFQMAGDHIGMDGIANGRHALDAVALEDSDVCVLPFAYMETLAREVPAMQRHLYKIFSREIVRESSMKLLLAGRRAEERIATFLLDLTNRLHARGYSKTELVLRMTREEIGSFLCINLETVSRTFSKFATDGILEVRHRHVHILDVDALRNTVAVPHSERHH